MMVKPDYPYTLSICSEVLTRPDAAKLELPLVVEPSAGTASFDAVWVEQVQ